MFIFAEVRDTSKKKSKGYIMELKLQEIFRQLYCNYSSCNLMLASVLFYVYLQLLSMNFALTKCSTEYK